jgi:hypothetical protein
MCVQQDPCCRIKTLLISSSPLCVLLSVCSGTGPAGCRGCLKNNSAGVSQIIFSVIFSAQQACWNSRSDGRLRRVGLGSYGPAAGLAAPVPSQSTIRLCVCVCVICPSVRLSQFLIDRHQILHGYVMCFSLLVIAYCFIFLFV